MTAQAQRLIQQHFSSPLSLSAARGGELRFLSVTTTGEALVEETKKGKFAVLDLNITLEFELRRKVANGTLGLTGQVLIREFGADGMSVRLICDEQKAANVAGLVGDVQAVVQLMMADMKEDGLDRIKSWLKGEFITLLLAIDSTCFLIEHTIHIIASPLGVEG